MNNLFFVYNSIIVTQGDEFSPTYGLAHFRRPIQISKASISIAMEHQRVGNPLNPTLAAKDPPERVV